MFTKHRSLPFYISLVVIYGNHNSCSVHAEVYQKPLILTPYIKECEIEKARELSQVNPEQFNGTHSYSGFFTVNQKYNSNLFFWFFPSQTGYPNAPLMLWLDGGPGESNMGSIFSGIGPLYIDGNGYAKISKHSCSKHHSVLYIENPVGTGYSFTDENGYVKNEIIVSTELYEAVQQFFLLFPEIQKNDFFLFGQSYGGKYVPSFAYLIHERNKNVKEKINLKGMIIGNSWSDPKHQAVFSEYLYQIGLIDINAKKEFIEYENILHNCIDDKHWNAATNEYNKMILSYNDSLYKNVTGFVGFHNYLDSVLDLKDYYLIDGYVQTKGVKEALHVGNISYCIYCDKVMAALWNDTMQSVASEISELLDHYNLLIFTGQLDILVAYPMTVNFLRNLNFKGADEYATAIRQKWYVDGELAGYIKQAQTLTEVLVRNAGHGVVVDKPYWALDLITKFIRNELF